MKGLHLLPWLAALAVYFVAGGYLGLGTQVLIMILFALSLDLALGHAGIVTLGHAAFFGPAPMSRATSRCTCPAIPWRGSAATLCCAVGPAR